VARKSRWNVAPQSREQPTNDSQRSSAMRLVVGVDGSESSWDAFWWAAGQARRTGSRVIAAFVSPSVDNCMVVASAVAGAPFDYVGAQEIAANRAEQLRRQVEDYAAEQEIPVSFIHASGDPTAVLTRIANQSRADIIVVGKSTKIRHHLAGSLGRRLIGQPKAPIVVVVP
jgi:nucleotide-binding universal stress UspA family protein